jgi:membrane protease YdiL (CAAX protease family)
LAALESRGVVSAADATGRGARPAWHLPAAALVAVAVGLGVALLVPRSFSDPVGVDPYDVRLAAVSLLLLGASLAIRSLRPTRAVLLAVAAITAPFCLWSAAPTVLHRLWPGLGGDEQFGWSGVAQVVLTAAFAAMAWRVLPAAARPDLRLHRLGRRAVAVAVGGTAVLLGLAMAVPATLLGRLGIEPVALARDMPWSAPGDVMQALAQELEFRGLLMGALERVAPPWAANLAQAVFFGLAHIAVQYEGPAGPFVPVTIGLGFVLGWITQRTGSLWPAIVIHAVAEVAVAVAVLPGLYGY